MTRKEAFYSLFTRHSRIRFTFESDNIDIQEFIEQHLNGDTAFDNGGDEIIIEPRNNTYNTQILYNIAESLEKQVFAANKTLAAHSFNRSVRQDSGFRFTMSKVSMEINDFTISVFQQSKWAKFYFDYDDYESKNKWKTLFIAYVMNFYLDKDFNLVEAYIDFIDLDEVSYKVYPENELDVEDMKSNINDIDRIKNISNSNKERWGII